MALEGVFPKIDGDILYASEANRFAGVGRLIFAGSGVSVNSGTAPQIIGSILISGGTLSNPNVMHGTAHITGVSDTMIILQLSGTTVNTSLAVSGPGGSTGLRYRILVGSPSLGMMWMEDAVTDGTSRTNGTNSALVALNTYPGSPHVIFLTGSWRNNSQLVSYVVHSEGRGY